MKIVLENEFAFRKVSSYAPTPFRPRLYILKPVLDFYIVLIIRIDMEGSFSRDRLKQKI